LAALGFAGCSSSGAAGKQEAGPGDTATVGAEVGGAPGLPDGNEPSDAVGKADGSLDVKANGGTEVSIDLPRGDVGQSNRDGGGDTGSGDGSPPRDVPLPSERIGGQKDVSGANDASGDLPSAHPTDGPTAQDGALASDAMVADAGGGGLEVEQCQPPPPNIQPIITSDLAVVSETYGLCQPPTDPHLPVDPKWDTPLEAGKKLYLYHAISCVDAGDPTMGTTTGVDRTQVLYALQATSTSPRRQRIYIVSVENQQSQVHAAYDIVYGSGSSSQPGAVDRMELVCGIPSSLPMFDGWTGSVGKYLYMTPAPSFGVVFIGSSAGETTPRLLYYLNYCPDLSSCGPPPQ
jgi:hypothetical protein